MKQSLASDSGAGPPSKKSKKGPLTIGYWNVRGLGAPLRMICEYMDYPYENKTYDVQTVSDPSKASSSESAFSKPSGAKFALAVNNEALTKQNALMNLPYIVDGKQVVCNAGACLTYFGRKFKLNGQAEIEICRNEQCLHQVLEMHREGIELFHHNPQDFVDISYSYFANILPVQLEKMQRWLIQNKTTFLASNSPTVCDFLFFELLDQHLTLGAQVVQSEDFHLLNPYPRLHAYYLTFTQLPAMKGYLDGKAHNLPIMTVSLHRLLSLHSYSMMQMTQSKFPSAGSTPMMDCLPVSQDLLDQMFQSGFVDLSDFDLEDDCEVTSSAPTTPGSWNSLLGTTHVDHIEKSITDPWTSIHMEKSIDPLLSAFTNST